MLASEHTANTHEHDASARYPRGSVTAVEVFELTTSGGASDFARVIDFCAGLGPYCLIGGLAVNCFVEPVYTLDADLVLAADAVNREHVHASELRIQFTLDPCYQPFVHRAVEREVLGMRVKVAQLDDIVQGKLWALSDPARRLAKRKKDELDLIRLAEAYPDLVTRYPPALRALLETSL